MKAAELSTGRALPGVAERVASGRAARDAVPLDAHAGFEPRDPSIARRLVLGQDTSRVPELVPVRHERMAVSPFTFYRGAARVMAADLATTPTTPLQAQLCGDAHLSNFGAYASPERNLVMDVNDFDETFPGPFEWDVKRLAASIVAAGRENGFTADKARGAVIAGVRTYREAMRQFARQPMLTVWYAHLALDEAFREYEEGLDARDLRRESASLESTRLQLRKARTRDSMQAVRKLTKDVDGRRRLVSDPPLIVPVDELTDHGLDAALAQMAHVFDDYRATLRPEVGHLLGQFEMTDAAHKVVGVGSVGLRAWVFLLEGPSPDDMLVLQAKQAAASVLSEHLEATGSPNEGERVVRGQRLMQAASDIFLGWVAARPDDSDVGDHYYVRQLRDWKMSVDLDDMRPRALKRYAALCGWTLARAHARSGDRIAIAAYLGKTDDFEEAIAEFAERYADQNERDHADFSAAIASGGVPVADEDAEATAAPVAPTAAAAS